MIKLQKTQVKIVSILIAVVFIGSVVALALTQSGSGFASAASSSVGVIDYAQVGAQHPQLAQADQQMQSEIEAAQKEFETQSANMNDQEKADYYRQTQERLSQRQAELMEPITKSIDDAVKSVADAKGLQVVLDKRAVLYGGQDITQDVVNKLK
jgi:outer membrane protein